MGLFLGKIVLAFLKKELKCLHQQFPYEARNEYDITHIPPFVCSFCHNSVRKNNLSVETLEYHLWFTIFSGNPGENIWMQKYSTCIPMLKCSFLEQDMRALYSRVLRL